MESIGMFVCSQMIKGANVAKNQEACMPYKCTSKVRTKYAISTANWLLIISVSCVAQCLLNDVNAACTSPML